MEAPQPHSPLPFINPYLAIMFGVFAVSFSSLFVKLSSAPSLTIATYRLLFTFLLLAPFSFAGGFKAVRGMSRKQVIFSALSGVFLALHFVSWFASLRYTSVASSVVLVTLQPVFVVAGSYLLFGERIGRTAMLGGGLAIVGSMVIGAADFQAGGQALWGDLLAIIAAVMVSGYLLIGRRLRGGLDLSGYTFIMYGASALTLVIASIANSTPFYPYSLRDWLIFVALAVVCTIFGHTVFNWALRYVQASVVSVSVLGEPLGAIVWASIFLGEFPSSRQLAGGAIIISGLYLFTRVAVSGEREDGKASTL